MISVRIVSTYDGVKTAQTLARLLSAEDHPVESCHGRTSTEQLETARAKADEAVVLIWSVDAPTQLYMRQWADAIPPARLIEIARAPNWPPLPARRFPVIDFSAWNGDRGGSSWRALNDRIRTLQRSLEPDTQQPARIAAGTLIAAGAAALGVAVWDRTHVETVTPQAAPQEAIVAETARDPLQISPGGVGGPVHIEEPASLDELSLLIEPAPRIRALEAPPENDLLTPEIAAPMRFRDSSLMGALSSLADPILHAGEEEAANEPATTGTN